MRFSLTTAVDYVNATPRADGNTTIVGQVVGRHRRLRGEEAFFLTGTEHASKVAARPRLSRDHV
jgi:methionyl-tRNA synthetase